MFDRLVARLGSRGHTVIVPEVVVWEWAQHAHEALAAAHSELARARAMTDGLNMPLPEFTVPTAKELADRIRSHVTALEPADIADTHPDHAVDAIAQQVLQIGTGSRSKDGVKTGAADALIAHTVEGQILFAEQLVVATADRKLAQLVGELDGNVVVVRDQRELWVWHGLTAPPSDQLILTIHQFLQRELTAEAVEGRTFSLFEHGVNLDASIFEDADFHTDDVRKTDVEVESVESVDVRGLEVVEGDDGPRLVVAEVDVQALTLVTNWFIGGPEAQLVDESANLMMSISAPITVELDQEWNPTTFDVNDRAEVESIEWWD